MPTLPSATTSLWVDGRLRSRHQSRDTWPQKKKGTRSLNQLLHTVARSERVVGYTTKCQLAQVAFSSKARCAHGMLFRQREIVANLRGGQGRSVPDNFLRRLREVVNVPHHCLATLSVAVHTGQLGIVSSLRIEGLPLPGYHLELTRHV